MYWINLAIMLIFIMQIKVYIKYTGFFYWFCVLFIAMVGTYFIRMTTIKQNQELCKR